MTERIPPDVDLSSVPDADKPGLLSTLRSIKMGGVIWAHVQNEPALLRDVRMLQSFGLISVQGDRCAVTADGEMTLSRHRE